MKPASRVPPTALPRHLRSLTAGDLWATLMQSVGRRGSPPDAMFGRERAFVRQRRVELSPGMSGILSAAALCQPPPPSLPPASLSVSIAASLPFRSAAVQSLEVGGKGGTPETPQRCPVTGFSVALGWAYLMGLVAR